MLANGITPIFPRCFNSRGLYTHGATSSNCVRLPNGELWVAVATAAWEIFLLRSTDEGFSWVIMDHSVSVASAFRSATTFEAHGPIINLKISETWDNIDVYFEDYYYLTNSYDVYRQRYSKAELLELGEYSIDPPNSSLILNEAALQGQYFICEDESNTYISYIVNTATSGNQKLRIKKLSPRSVGVSTHYELNLAPLSTIMGSTATVGSGLVDNIIVHVTDGNRVLKHVRFNSATGTYGVVHSIETVGAEAAVVINDISVEADGHGTLCAVYSVITVATNAVEVRYALSTNDGATWTVATLTRTEDHTAFVDSLLTKGAARTEVMGGADGGFLFHYTENNAAAVAKVYFRKLSTVDGSTYTLGAEKEGATGLVDATDKVVAAHFFKPLDNRLVNLSDPSHVKVAYSVGEGDTTSLADSISVVIAQESLNRSAYPSASSTGSYITDVAGAGEALVTFTILSGPSENVDYYSLNITGEYTDRYIAAFNSVGTSTRLLKYEPMRDNFMNDKSTYDAPTVHVAKAVLDPESYRFPTPQLLPVDQKQWIEQDVRKLHLPPTMHLSRTLLVNKGGYLKRTVWLCEFDGNAYEISQVVPRFLNNQICYYEANAYVVGPSRDPFSRAILPSET